MLIPSPFPFRHCSRCFWPNYRAGGRRRRRNPQRRHQSEVTLVMPHDLEIETLTIRFLWIDSSVQQFIFLPVLGLQQWVHGVKILIPRTTYLAEKSSTQNLCHICQTLRLPDPLFQASPSLSSPLRSTFTTNAPFSPSIAVGCCCCSNLCTAQRVASVLGMRLCWKWLDVHRITLSTA